MMRRRLCTLLTHAPGFINVVPQRNFWPCDNNCPATNLMAGDRNPEPWRSTGPTFKMICCRTKRQVGRFHLILGVIDFLVTVSEAGLEIAGVLGPFARKIAIGLIMFSSLLRLAVNITEEEQRSESTTGGMPRAV